MFGGSLGPVPAGFITDSMGWPWVLFWCAILNAIAFVACFFALEETMYVRQVDQPTSIALSQALEGREKKIGLQTDVETDASSDEHRDEAVTYTVDTNISRVAGGHNTSTQTGINTDISISYPARSYFRKLAPFERGGDGPADVLRKISRSVGRSFQMLRFPGVVFAGFMYGCYMCWYAVVNATLSIFFGSSPYNFSPSVRLNLFPGLDIDFR